MKDIPLYPYNSVHTGIPIVGFLTGSKMLSTLICIGCNRWDVLDRWWNKFIRSFGYWPEYTTIVNINRQGKVFLALKAADQQGAIWVYETKQCRINAGFFKVEEKWGGCSFVTPSPSVGVHVFRSMPWQLTYRSEILLLVGALWDVWYITWHQIPSSTCSVLKWWCNLYVHIVSHKSTITSICFC